jgi:hypothetical protein
VAWVYSILTVQFARFATVSTLDANAYNSCFEAFQLSTAFTFSGPAQRGLQHWSGARVEPVCCALATALPAPIVLGLFKLWDQHAALLQPLRLVPS